MVTIGISANWDLKTNRLGIPNDYMNAVIRAGGLPVLLPRTDDEAVLHAMVDNTDGIIFPGGEDIHPGEFGEDVHPACGTIVPERDRLELSLYRFLLSSGKPFLAICRGIQLVNVAQGGTLYQDIGSQYDTSVNHAEFSKSSDTVHHVKTIKGTLLSQLTGSERLPVNSRHHQAVKDLGKGLIISALSDDGLIEAVEFENGYPGLAFQWHPENLSGQDPRMQAVFDWLVKEAGKKA